MFISCKVTYLNILFFKRFQSVSKVIFSSLVQAEGTSPPTPWVLLCMYFFEGHFPLQFYFVFFPTSNPPPPPPLNHFSSGPFLNHLLIYSQLNKSFSITRSKLLAVQYFCKGPSQLKLRSIEAETLVCCDSLLLLNNAKNIF